MWFLYVTGTMTKSLVLLGAGGGGGEGVPGTKVHLCRYFSGG